MVDRQECLNLNKFTFIVTVFYCSVLVSSQVPAEIKLGKLLFANSKLSKHIAA